MMLHIASQRKFLFRVCLASTVVALASCDRAAITGRVYDMAGSTLAGVVVGTEDGEFQAVTNPLGMFKFYAPRGSYTLTYMKTGYAPATAAFDGQNQPEPVRLWCLPDGAGLFVYAGNQYAKVGQAEAKAFSTGSTASTPGLAYAVPKQEKITQIQPGNRLFLSKTPFYDANVTRLSETEATGLGGAPAPQRVWVPASRVPAQVAPVDEPKHLLAEVRFLDPLEPGVYALHWGALNGYSATDSRLFLFAVASPEPPQEAPRPVEEKPEKSKAKKVTKSE